MKKYLLTLSFCGLTLIMKSQTPSVEDITFGVQTGFLGAWVYNETRISDQITLRGEIGFDSGFWGGDYYDKSGYVFTPSITVEPRWYYNLSKRLKASKEVSQNNGNFIALRANYHPDWFVISNYDDINIISDISIIPTWGINRTLGTHFNYEVGIGIGYRYIIAKQAGYSSNESEAALNLHLRIGYHF